MLHLTLPLLSLLCLENNVIVHCIEMEPSQHTMSEFVTVEIPQGKLQGKKVTSPASGVTYYSFQGIPYAKPPLGSLRFKPPEEPELWEGTRDATKEGDVCLQTRIFSDIMAGSEDCLFLNVYTPQLSAASPKPVMVWIHGGKFMGGSSSTRVYGPDFLVAEDVILVTINYRLGALGFLYLEGSDITGNNGFRDQVMALKWVKKNIAQFGGDPGNVTIFGQSAGGGAVHFLMLSPLASGLFHRAIAESGTVFIGGCNLSVDVSSRRARRVAKLLGCASEDPQEIASFLRTIPAEKFLRNREKAQAGEELHQALDEAFFPSYEVGEEAFLPDSPRKLVEGGKFTKVPFIIGVTSAEAKGMAMRGPPPTSKLSQIDQIILTLVPIDLSNEVGQEKSKEIASLMKKFYFNEKQTTEDALAQLINVLSDYEFVFPMHRVVKQQAKWSPFPTYAYVFDYESPLDIQNPENKFPGAHHTGELPYLFQGEKPVFPPASPDAKMRRNMVKLWTNFAKTGNPTSKALNITWRPVTSQDLSYLRINGGFNMEADMFKRRIHFWEDLYNQFLPQ